MQLARGLKRCHFQQHQLTTMALGSFYSLLVSRMMAVADEIFDSVKESIIEYEQEIERLRQENCCLRSRRCRCVETCNGTSSLRDEVLQDQSGSQLSEIRMKLEVATVMSPDPLGQAASIVSSLSEDVTGQEPDQCLTLLPKEMVKNEDSGGTDASITVKCELFDHQTSELNSSPALPDRVCQLGYLISEQDVQTDLETFNKKIRKGRQKQKSVICKICGKSFKSKEHLQSHVILHQNERPFSCASCGIRFKTKFNLKEHERIHSGDYRYSCPRCGRGFSRSNHVRNHLNSARCFLIESLNQ